MFILLTGFSKAGKTTACWKALPELRATGVKLAGFISPPVLDAEGRKSAIQMVDLATGQRQVFARVAGPGEAADVGAYKLAEGAVEWAQELLSAALVANVDWLVIDEIGPLELQLGGGFAFALRPLADPVRIPNAIVLVRERLADTLAERLGRADIVRMNVTAENRAAIPGQLVRLVRESLSKTGPDA